MAAAGLALRDRDEAALRALGLNLSELDELDSFEQAERLLEVLGESFGGFQEEELNAASAAALLALLSDAQMTGPDAVRVYVVEYVYEVSLSEIGDQFRDGTRDGFTTVAEEDKLKALIKASVDQVELPDNLQGKDVAEIIYVALDDARTFLRAAS